MFQNKGEGSLALISNSSLSANCPTLERGFMNGGSPRDEEANSTAMVKMNILRNTFYTEHL